MSDKIEKYIAPAKGKKHALIILREFIELIPKSKGTNLDEALKFFRNTQKKRTIAFVMSDFIDDSNFIEGFKISKKKHDMVAIRLVDEAERELPDIGLIQLYNSESGETTWVSSSSQQAKDIHSKNFTDYEEKLFDRFQKSGIDYASISTSEDFIKPLVKLFQNR